MAHAFPSFLSFHSHSCSPLSPVGFFIAPTLGFVAATVFSLVLSEVAVTVVVDVEGVIVSLAVDPPVSSVPGLRHGPGPRFRPRCRTVFAVIVGEIVEVVGVSRSYPWR
jgi:hypothetical protein